MQFRSSSQLIFKLGLSMALSVLASRVAIAEVPGWATNGAKLTDDSFVAPCEGEGPSVDLARASALESCKASAAHALSKRFTVSTLTVETERSAGLHEEVSTNDRFSNLQCSPQKEQVQESAGSFTVWILCLFKTGGVRADIVTPEAKEDEKPAVLPVKAINGNVIRGENRTIVATVVPPCQTVMVVGSNPRIINCTSSPIMIVVSPKDRELIFRSDRFVPAHIKLDGERRTDDTVQVLLQPL